MAEDKHIVFSYGRMNPPTAGHSKVVDKVKSHADKIGANHAVVVSHSQNNNGIQQNTLESLETSRIPQENT